MIPGTNPLQLPSPPGRLVGVYPALVTDVQDPDGQGRVQVSLPFTNGQEGPAAAAWARLATFMAGADRGSWFVPEVNDEVLVAFLAGDARHPVVIGALWNGVDAPPETMDADNNLRSITSRSGHRLLFDDTAAATKVVLATQGGHRLTLDDAAGGTVTLEHDNGARIRIDGSGTILIQATNRVSVEAPAGLNVSAAMVTVDAALSSFSGVVKADTVITNSVVSASYTPGAGNVW
jgi:uncharacterized protein involved in type VI secretion and phage assembly